MRAEYLVEVFETAGTGVADAAEGADAVELREIGRGSGGGGEGGEDGARDGIGRVEVECGGVQAVGRGEEGDVKVDVFDFLDGASRWRGDFDVGELERSG